MGFDVMCEDSREEKNEKDEGGSGFEVEMWRMPRGGADKSHVWEDENLPSEPS